MLNQNQLEKEIKGVTSEQVEAAPKAPAATRRELTDDEFAAIAGGVGSSG